MSNRLAGKARKAARRNARGLETPAYAVLKGPVPAADDPWAGIPEGERITSVEVRNGVVITTYLDSLDDLRKRRRPAHLPLPPKPRDPPRPPRPEPVRADGEWARLEKADDLDGNASE